VPVPADNQVGVEPVGDVDDRLGDADARHLYSHGGSVAKRLCASHAALSDIPRRLGVLPVKVGDIMKSSARGRSHAGEAHQDGFPHCQHNRSRSFSVGALKKRACEIKRCRGVLCACVAEEVESHGLIKRCQIRMGQTQSSCELGNVAWEG
jgi:hypothetical protein